MLMFLCTLYLVIFDNMIIHRILFAIKLSQNLAVSTALHIEIIGSPELTRWQDISHYLYS